MKELWSKISTGIAVLVISLLFFVLGSGLWAQRQWFPTIGGFFLIDVFVILAAIPFAIVIAGYIWFHRGNFIPTDQYGGYLQKGKKIIPLAPLMAVSPKIAGSTKVAEIEAPAIPRLGELIRDNLLIKEDEEGMPLMLQGYRADSTPRYGSWPGVIGVAGMQNVGKSVTIETLAIIALMQHAHVVVCDTHHTKARSLYKKMQTLTGYVAFARTEQEVLQEARKFSQELKSRKNGSEPYTYVLVLDEAASVIRSDIGKEIVTVIEEASQEGHGYNLHLVLAIHDFSKDGLGDARIRDFLNWIYCHRMQSGQSKFVEAFNSRKTKAAIAALPPGHTVAKDEVNEIEYLIMPFADSKDALAARKWLDDNRALPPAYVPAQVVSRNAPRYEQIAQYTSAPREVQAHTWEFPARPGSEIESFGPETGSFAQGEINSFAPEMEELSRNERNETESFATRAGRKQEIARLRSLNYTQSQIIQHIWKAKPGDNLLYKEALAEYKAILLELLQQA